LQAITENSKRRQQEHLAEQRRTQNRNAVADVDDGKKVVTQTNSAPPTSTSTTTLSLKNGGKTFVFYEDFDPHPVLPDWVIYWTLGNFSKPLAAINLAKYPTFLGNYC